MSIKSPFDFLGSFALAFPSPSPPILSSSSALTAPEVLVLAEATDSERSHCRSRAPPRSTIRGFSAKMGHALIGTGECLPCVGIVACEEKIIEEDSALQLLSDNRKKLLSDNRKKRPAYEARGGRAKAALQLGSIAEVGSKRTNHSSSGKRCCLSPQTEAPFPFCNKRCPASVIPHPSNFARTISMKL